LTAKRGDGEAGNFDLGALMVPLAVGAGLAIYGLEAANSQTGQKMDIPLGVLHLWFHALLIYWRPVNEYISP
jgi:hypothetical protein